MAEAIENVIDSWLIERFTEQMGSGGSYTNLKLQQIDTAILRVPKDWEGWTLPAMAISNRFVHRQPGGHPFRLDKLIVYLLTFVTYGTESTAIRDSRTLITRAELALIAIKNSLSGLSNDYGEITNSLTFFSSQHVPSGTGDSRLRKYIDPKNASRWFVAQDLSVVFNTTTGV